MAVPAFKILTLLENLTAYGEAVKVQRLLQDSCGTGQASECLILDFSLFNHNSSWEAAVKEAGVADAIIISISGAAELPVPIQRWMESWKERVLPNETALIVVFGPDSSNPGKERDLLGYFQTMAAKHGLDFFCNRSGYKGLIPSA